MGAGSWQSGGVDPRLEVLLARVDAFFARVHRRHGAEIERAEPVDFVAW